MSGVTTKEILTALRQGTPSIELNPNSGQPANQGIPSNANTLVVGVWMLQPGEDAIVGRRIRRCSPTVQTSLLKKLKYMAFKFGLVYNACVGQSDPSLPVDEKCHRHGCEVVLLRKLVIANHDRYSIAMFPPVSVSIFLARNGITTLHPSSSIETPMTARPCPRNFSSNSMYQGISRLQPPHQVAQKSSRTT